MYWSVTKHPVVLMGLVGTMLMVGTTWSRKITFYNQTPYDLQVNIGFIAAEDVEFDSPNGFLPAGQNKTISAGGIALMKSIAVKTVNGVDFKPDTTVVVEPITFGAATIALLGGQKQLDVNSSMKIRISPEGVYRNDIAPSTALTPSTLQGYADYGAGQSIFNDFLIYLDYVALDDGEIGQRLKIHRF